ncbi:hypothetical protein A3B21_00165 [Candidatus Uhrbacteria bacterium RIFCSPLOWO2_01_FULL_47_24]|uniref:NodB homology domain-containing protein n=1 Tax=Candidatus Uhrbacteria bacterium RIFCSPLOWO2_01_FULL_47_24 TaxID=1802401 RepID=A0A1F7USU5_9BACT|nr:MAG: hypothetical protein A2753_02265 [Candidatus Uhrbacteria bacterium RIFCSPHIGHO2_01_FULL_47_11]OGL68011.1 MAG: hypothetical protein A3D58_01540 [Candidatus Uhrbacteria bacterium RIFCSPHIGHO2_02_FULL_46_47]OGL75422.1 MAG: hypothetical protein A3F52_04880 [Candidatus Uhrbacteria bacterium RIFCSPHIGHO2_12_FULL_47_11]OGL81325.1 MAG: hypothetical protein A3B21_00165 [Candidatus Uhrbacteria bacterium RIFCSPLOWO2_01_FULL_47_24]OGL83931.1 MAG: hypothetical protein A3J03_00740 [Candidatus Uhrbact
MTYRALLKRYLWRMTAQLLAKKGPQQRVIIFHDIHAFQETLLRNFLSFLDVSTAIQTTITFDDGFHSSYRAIQALKNRKAIFFVSPEFINRAHTDRWQEFFHYNLLRTEDLRQYELERAVRPASWDDLRTLVKLGHAIGSHTMTHTRLSKIRSQKELEYEIIGSGDLIEDMLQVKVDHFAYPFGDIDSIDERAYKIIKRRYRTCFTGIRGNNIGNENKYTQWRDPIDLGCPIKYQEFLLQGGFDWYYTSQRSRLAALSQ